MTSSNEFKVQVSSYINAFGVERSTAYEALQKAVDTLINRRFSYYRIVNDQQEKVTTNWVQSVAYATNEAISKLNSLMT